MAAEECGAGHYLATFRLELQKPQGIPAGLNQGPVAGGFQDSANRFIPAGFHPCLPNPYDTYRG